MITRSMFVLALLATTTRTDDAAGQAKPDPSSQRVGTIEATLMRSATRADNRSDVGRDLVAQALQIAAARFRTDTSTTLTIEVPVVIRVFQHPRVPSPTEIDVCWEMSSGLHEYIECSAPDVIITPPRPNTCDLLWRRFRAATDPASRRTLFLQLMANGCIDWSAVRIQQ